MNLIKKINLSLLIITFVFISVFYLSSEKVRAAADIAISSATITSSNTVVVRFVNPGQNLLSVDATKWHIDRNTGGSSPLNPASALVTTPGTPWVVTLTFSGTPFSDTATAYDASHGLYVDASGVTDTNSDTNAVVAHGSSVAIADGQAPAFVSASAVGNTTINVVFSEDVTVVHSDGSDFDLTANGVTFSGAAVDGDDASIVVLTSSGLEDMNFYSTGGLDIAATAVRDISTATNANIQTLDRDVADAQVPLTPTADPVSGTDFTGSQTVTLTSTGSTSIHYTINGDVPDCASGSTTNPFVLNIGTSVKVVGCDDSDNVSSMATFVYDYVYRGGGSISTPPPTPTPETPNTTPAPEITVTVTPPTPVVVDPGCSGGNSINTSTGKPCVNNVGNEHQTSSVKYDLGTTTLKNGSKGEAVMELQKLLSKVLNLGLAIDGKLGPKTISVIKKWQKDHGLKVDGLVGVNTKAKMKAEAEVE